MSLILRLGGKSAIKVAALRAGIGALTGIINDVSPISAPSGIPEQPWGDVTTAKGALNRALLAWAHGSPISEVPANVIGAGIENGISEIVTDLYIDFAVILMIKGGCVYSATSAGVQFPATYVNEAKRRIAAGEVELTVGKVIAEHHPGVDHTDPHSFLTGGKFSRLKILTDAVTLCGAQFIL
jgi:non-canonical (house-cleaning) NTP pyrophosphatase